MSAEIKAAYDEYTRARNARRLQASDGLTVSAGMGVEGEEFEDYTVAEEVAAASLIEVLSTTGWFEARRAFTVYIDSPRADRDALWSTFEARIKPLVAA